MPSSPVVVSTLSMRPFIRTIPRPRFAPRGSRQRPESRTDTTASPPGESVARTSIAPRPGAYACSMTLAQASQALSVISSDSAPEAPAS